MRKMLICFLFVLNIESKRLPPNLHGQLFAENLYAFICMQDWILCRQLLEFFTDDVSLGNKAIASKCTGVGIHGSRDAQVFR